MSNHTHSASRFSSVRKLWKPAIATGAGETSLILWFEEVIAFATDFIGVIILAILGGMICLFNNLIFKSRIPRREDLQDTMNKRKER